MSINNPSNKHPYSNIREDLIDTERTKEDSRIIVEYEYNKYVANYNSPPKLRTIGNAKSLKETMELVKDAIDDYESENKVINPVNLTYDEPLEPAQMDVIVISPGLKKPGQFAAGPPSKGGGIRERTMHLRETKQDPTNIGYRIAVMGQWFDNWVTFTAWSRTGKEAYDRAEWFQKLMRDYQWFFESSGVNKILFERRLDRITKKSNNSIIYGYPMEYYIRTEEIFEYSEKTLERLVIKFNINFNE